MPPAFTAFQNPKPSPPSRPSPSPAIPISGHPRVVILALPEEGAVTNDVRCEISRIRSAHAEVIPAVKRRIHACTTRGRGQGGNGWLRRKPRRRWYGLHSPGGRACWNRGGSRPHHRGWRVKDTRRAGDPAGSTHPRPLLSPLKRIALSIFCSDPIIPQIELSEKGKFPLDCGI